MILGDDFLLKADFADDALPLGLDSVVGGGDTAELRKGGETVVVAATHGEPSRAEWEEVDSETDAEGRDHLETEGKSESKLSGQFFGGVCDPICDDSANNNAVDTVNLLSIIGLRYLPNSLENKERSSQVRRRNLGNVQRGSHGKLTNTDTSNRSTGDEGSVIVRGSLSSDQPNSLPSFSFHGYPT